MEIMSLESTKELLFGKNEVSVESIDTGFDENESVMFYSSESAREFGEAQTISSMIEISLESFDDISLESSDKVGFIKKAGLAVKAFLASIIKAIMNFINKIKAWLKSKKSVKTPKSIVPNASEVMVDLIPMEHSFDEFITAVEKILKYASKDDDSTFGKYASGELSLLKEAFASAGVPNPSNNVSENLHEYIYGKDSMYTSMSVSGWWKTKLGDTSLSGNVQKNADRIIKNLEYSINDMQHEIKRDERYLDKSMSKMDENNPTPEDAEYIKEMQIVIAEGNISLKFKSQLAAAISTETMKYMAACDKVNQAIIDESKKLEK